VIELSTHGYEILRADEEFSVCRARQDGEQSTILVVTPVSEYPALESLAHLENEYSFRDELDLDWAARPLTLTRTEALLSQAASQWGSFPALPTSSGKQLSDTGCSV
jgi:hypothetical protein